MDCRADTYASEEYYMLRAGLWRSINRRVDGMLCLRCAERRLRRGLVNFDFTDAPANSGQARICQELATRLSRVVSRRRRRWTGCWSLAGAGYCCALGRDD